MLPLLLALGVAAAIVVADQLSKSWAEGALRQGPVHVLGPLDLSLGYNTGSAFSLFTGSAPLLVVLGSITAVVLGWLAWRTRRPGVAVALGLVLGGASSNVADRLTRGHHGAVVDFISLRYWPTFNVADAAIVVGAVLLVLLVLLGPARQG